MLVLFGAHLGLNRQLKHARLERDQALALLGGADWKICAQLKKLEPCITDCAMRRVIDLQSEISKLRAEGLSLKMQAYHDDLTGLANRLLLADRFLLAVERSKRSGQCFTLLMIDLNGFKVINDTYGHASGDIVLVTTAKRLVAAVRASDTVARLGGDEFVVLIESTENLTELAHIGQKLINTLSDDIALNNGKLIRVGASLGLALYPDDGGELNDLLHIADMGMYECKSTGMMSLH